MRILLETMLVFVPFEMSGKMFEISKVFYYNIVNFKNNFVPGQCVVLKDKILCDVIVFKDSRKLISKKFWWTIT